MRGKPADAATTPAPTRITPADAGKTLIISVIFDRRRDHPRGCGENWVYWANDVTLTGITPADAGKTPGQTANYNNH